LAWFWLFHLRHSLAPKASTPTVAPDRTIREGIALMISKAYGDRIGAAFSERYIDRVEANIADRRYERCEEMFDLAQYNAQLQQEQAQAQAATQAQERQKLLVERSNSPEMQEKLKSASLGDLVKCEKAVQNKDDNHAADVKAMVSYICEREIDRRVDSGLVSRDKINKMLNQG